ncbi:hypothetical protein EDC54_10143 [Samsonia erythrinae]|uniref:Uncharacterized protein n=1 Tax=Samsonia erythrinae TaxID=160434 RepID=A0A4R3VV50_9GAMM|nr:hypothetical protein EDC54_10143 [Samsonia erythrinae]
MISMNINYIVIFNRQRFFISYLSDNMRKVIFLFLFDGE